MYKFIGKLGKIYSVEFFKQNANCPDSEKNGTGPGSCGGSSQQKELPTIKEFPNNIKLKTETVNGKTRYSVIAPDGKVSLDTTRVNDVEKTIRSLVKYYGKGKTDSEIKIDLPKSKPITAETKKTKTTETSPSPKQEIKKSTLSTTKSIDIPSRQVNLPLGTARVYSISSAKITIQDGMNKAKADKMLQTIKNLPEKLLSENPEILVRKGDSRGGKQSTKLSEEYGRKFVKSGHAGGNSIVLYDLDTETAIHEIAHTFDKSNHRHSSSKEYEDAVNADSGFTSKYAKDSYKVYYFDSKRRYSEDFADGIASFLESQDWFSSQFPNRSKYYKKILGM